MKKMGILLAFAPEQPITNQGIGRLTAFIISAVLKNEDMKIVLAAPDWYKSIILDFLADHRIDINRIEIITTSGIPVLLRVRGMIKKYFMRPKTAKIKSLSAKIQNKIKNIDLGLIMKGLSAYSLVSFTLTSVLLFILMAPLIVFGGLAWISWKFLRPILRALKLKLEARFNVKMNFLSTPFAKFKRNPLLAPLAAFRRNLFAYRFYHGIRAAELEKLIKIMNAKNDINVWFIPTLFWPEIASIKAKKVVAAPDIVFFDFPLLFANSFFGMIYDQIKRTIEVADHFICYSKHVKQKHLLENFFLDADKVSVIKHGAISLESFLEDAGKLSRSKNNVSAKILQNYQEKALKANLYLRNFDLMSTQYIFYSSQIRPHKNFMSLIKAYEKLLRERFVNIKLITTANLKQEEAVWSYIHERRLQYDILSFPEVSSEVLAALNHRAICAVNPTLFEGGFPFTFAEAYSVGTPSIMSRIPVVLDEVTEPELQEKMLFDPYNLDDMVNKIEWAVKNRQALLDLEEPLYRRLETRTWEKVAEEYIEVFKSVGGQHEAMA